MYKSSLSLKPVLNAEWETFPPEMFISSQLLSLTESSVARKFVVHHDDTKNGLLVSPRRNLFQGSDVTFHNRFGSSTQIFAIRVLEDPNSS